MTVTPEELNTIYGGLGEKYAQIAMQAKQIEEQAALIKKLTEERDMWKTRAIESCKDAGTEHKNDSDLIVISTTKLSCLFSRIRSIEMKGMLISVIQALLPNNTSSEIYKLISQISPLKDDPQIKIDAKGDVKVDGDYQDIHDNYNVSL